MSTSYRDFIPEGEDPGALGQGFKDFVPAKVPEIKVSDTTPQEDLQAKRIAALQKAREAKKTKQLEAEQK